MGNEDYELIDELESISNSLKNMAESQKKIADILEWLAKDRGMVDLSE
jgi:hypothetical protein